jgi:hypothetical protein
MNDKVLLEMIDSLDARVKHLEADHRELRKLLAKFWPHVRNLPWEPHVVNRVNSFVKEFLNRCI